MGHLLVEVISRTSIDLQVIKTQMARDLPMTKYNDLGVEMDNTSNCTALSGGPFNEFNI